MKNRPLYWFLGFGMVWIYGITILRGIRTPSDWAEGHWLIGYQFGFLKRALPGTFLYPFVTPQNGEGLIALVSTACLFAFLIALLWISYRILKKTGVNAGSTLAVLVFLTSPYIVMSAFLNGYYDNLLVLFTMACILLTMKGKDAPAAVVLSIGILVHENIFVVGFPTILLASILRQLSEEGSFDWKTSLRRLSPLILPILVFTALFLYQSFYVNGDALRSRLSSHLAQFEFVQKNRGVRVPDAFTISFLDYTEKQSQFFVSRLLNKNHLIRILPSLLAILLFAVHIAQKNPARKWIVTLLIVTSLLPLSLHLIARDTSRIWTFPLIAAFLGLWIIAENRKETKPIQFHAAYPILFTLVIVHNFFLQTPLMDGMSERYSDGMRFWFYIPALILVLLVLMFLRKHQNESIP